MRQKISSQVGNQLLRGSGGNTWQDRGAQQAGAVMTLNPYYQNNWFARWQEWARWYFTSWEARKIVEIPVDDALRVPFEITGIDEKYADLLWDGMKKLDFLNKIKRIAIQERMLGGCVGIMGIRSEHAHTDDPSLPLDLNEIDFNDLSFFNVVSINQISKADWETDPLSPNFDKPKYYYINGIKTHTSRLIVFDGNPLFSYQSQRLIQNYRINAQGFGESVLTPVYDALVRCTGAQQAGYHLINMASILLVKVDKLLELQGTKPGEKSIELLRQLVEQLSIYRGGVIEGKGVDVQNVSASFGSVPELLMSYLKILSAASDIPVTRFLGEAPGGLNATGKSDLENYYNHIDAYRNEKIKPKVLQFFDVLGPSVLGKRVWDSIKKDVDLKFPPLWNMSEEQKAVVDRTRAEVALMLTEAGLLSREDAADEINKRKILNITIDKDNLPDMMSEAYGDTVNPDSALDALSGFGSSPLKANKPENKQVKASADLKKG